VRAENNTNVRLIPDINRLIHEPARYNIMALLYVIERAEFLFVQNQIHLTPGNLSTHVSKLEAAHYVDIQKKFVGKKPKTFLKMTKSGRNAFKDYRKKMKELLSGPIRARGKSEAEENPFC
jgi:DNA-binding MarR family transcriptional regulator